MSKPTIYFSIDIETDGQCPGLSSMRQLGCAAFSPRNPKPIATFQRNFAPLPEAEPEAETMLWWQKFPEVWKRVTENPISPALATAEFNAWVRETAKDAIPVAIAWPACWDWAFVYYYFMRFLGYGKSPFGHTALDVKSLWFAYTLKHWAEGRTYKADVPAEWRGGAVHTHIGLDDAIEQGRILIHLLQELGA